MFAKIWKIAFAVIITSLLLYSAQTICGEQKAYRAALVEYRRNVLTSRNIENYRKYIEAAKLKNVDIVLFPESTLTTDTNGSLVPDPAQKVIPYLTDVYATYESVRAMSEAAANHKVYVVVNMYERVECANNTRECPPRGYFLYNTNVVFDRLGAVIAKYRKYNIYEITTDKPKKDLPTFTTDFGVTFGMIICFDILFKIPSIELVQEKNIKNFLFSAFWYGELPFLTASQVQAGWSYAMNVTLLAAGANKPAIGTTGTGLYLGRGKSYRAMREIDMNVISFFTIPLKDSPQKSVSLSDIREERDHHETQSYTLNLLSDPSIPLSTGTDLHVTAGRLDNKICNGGLCCTFSASYRNSMIPNMQKYKYRAIVYQGTRRFGENNWHEVAYCGVVLCLEDNCAAKPPNDQYPLVFDEIAIEGVFKGKDTFQLPTTLVYKKDDNKHSLMDILENDDFTFKSERISGQEASNVSMKLLKKNVGNLITFGIYGRIF